MKKEKIFLDSDVILDLLTEREPHFEPAFALFLRIQNNTIEAYTSPVVFANIFYILNRKNRKVLGNIPFVQIVLENNIAELDKDGNCQMSASRFFA